MSIRPAKVEELKELVAIWLDASIEAHHFIAPQYWTSQAAEMENKYLPSLKTTLSYKMTIRSAASFP